MRYQLPPLLLIALSTVIVGLFAWHAPERAEASQLCRAHFEAAQDITGMQPLGGCPEVRVETSDWFERVPCGGDTPCTITGVVLTDSPNVVHIRPRGTIGAEHSADLRRALWRSTLVHEMVHVLQMRNGFLPLNREACNAMESHAYRAQVEFLRRQGWRAAMPENLGC